MRNLGFAAGVAAALIGGGLIGAFADFSSLGLPALNLPGPAAREPADPLGPRLDRLDFSIDATRSHERPPAKSAYGSGPPVDRGYEPNGCAMPRAQDGAQLVLLGAYEGDAFSTVALNSQDHETGVIEVVIEPGDRPLYVVLSAFSPTIWRFSGATDRVRKAVMVASKGGAARTPPRSDDRWSRSRNSAATAMAASASARRAAEDAVREVRSGLRRATQPTTKFAGIIGLDAARVSTSEDIRCFDYFSEPGSPKAVQAVSVVRRATGRAPDVVAGHYSMAAIRLPSAVAAKGPGRIPAPQGFDAGMWREAVRFSPAGISPVRREAILSAVDTVAYEVLPSQAGLAQLLGSGQLVRSDGALKIVRPIPRFPAELNGAHSTSFILGRGVPIPAGSPGHSCVINEGTGRAATGMDCF